MNLNKLFDTQEILDERIKEEKGLQGVDFLDEKILALRVELGELANEWRGFKFWSEEQHPRTHEIKTVWDRHKKHPMLVTNNPMLEEYADCLSFILSIGNENKTYTDFDVLIPYTGLDTVKQFNLVFDGIVTFKREMNWVTYKDMLSVFVGLGEMLGFTWEQIEQAYYSKNKINHKRQDDGY